MCFRNIGSGDVISFGCRPRFSARNEATGESQAIPMRRAPAKIESVEADTQCGFRESLQRGRLMKFVVFSFSLGSRLEERTRRDTCAGYTAAARQIRKAPS
ncbi:unnamed protein product, partial [Hapterophycus canaliculatus]